MIPSTISRLGFLSSHQLDLTGRELMGIQPFQREPAALTYVDIPHHVVLLSPFLPSHMHILQIETASPCRLFCNAHLILQ